MKTLEELAVLSEKIVRIINSEVNIPVEMSAVLGMVSSCINGQTYYISTERMKRGMQ
jgi:hypothetical protein